MVRALAERAAVGNGPESPLGLIRGATCGLAGATTMGPADAGVPAFVGACAPSGTVPSTSRLATIHAVPAGRIYFRAGGAMGGGGTGSENITRPLTSS